MGEKYKRQENLRIQKQLLRENMRRVLYSSAVMTVLIPVVMLVYSFLSIDDELKSTLRSFMVGYEVLSIIFGVIAYFVFRARDGGFGKVVVRSYWAFFVLFSFVMLYTDAMTGNGLFYYSILLAVISFIPLLSNTEIMYYFVTQAVFIIFLMIKFGFVGKNIVDIVLMNVIFFVLSRMFYKAQTDKYILREKLKSVKKGSGKDPLTGLYNRRGLDNRLSTELVDAIKSKRRISVLMIDIDMLGQYNRECGYSQGDECIKTVAGLIKRIVLRNTDVVCRMSGGKFLVFMCGGSDMEPVTLAEKVRSGIERQRIPFSRANNRFVTVSIGAASTIPRSESNFTEIYDEADEAMYEAKSRGRNIIVYDEQIYGRKAKREIV